MERLLTAPLQDSFSLSPSEYLRNSKAEKKMSRSDKKRRREIDRISSLPDTILHHILSFLDTREAIKTCVLSKRWNPLLVSLPNLHFDGNPFNSKKKFQKFVVSVLSRRDYSISVNKVCSRDRFRRPTATNEYIIQRIISYAVSHAVQHLDLLMSPSSDFPKAILGCRSIKTLELSGGVRILPDVLAFKTLDSLFLKDCIFELPNRCDYFDPFAACFNLKNLSISGSIAFVGPGPRKAFRVSGIQLINLLIAPVHTEWRLSKVEVVAPNLMSFRFCHPIPLDFDGLNLPSLNHVEIHVSRYVLKRGIMAVKKKAYLDLINMFQGFHNVQFVNVNLSVIEILNLDAASLKQLPSPFTNLKTLKLRHMPYDTESPSIYFHAVNYFLSGSPNAGMIFIKF